MTPWLQQLGRVLTEVPERTEGGAQGSTSSRGAALRGQPASSLMRSTSGKGAPKDMDARVAELRRRYRRVRKDPQDAVPKKSSVDRNWF